MPNHPRSTPELCGIGERIRAILRPECPAQPKPRNQTRQKGRESCTQGKGFAQESDHRGADQETADRHHCNEGAIRVAADNTALVPFFFASLLAEARDQPLSDVDGGKPAKKRFKRYPIGYFHVDLAEVRTAEGKLYLFVAIDRTSKFTFAQLVPKAGKLAAAQFLRDLIAMVPYRINIVLTDNGIQFTNRKRDTSAFEHAFDRVCREHQSEHRLTKVKHPWTNGQVERMNRTIKDATVKRFHYDTHDQLERHLADFLDAYNYARRLKTLSGLTPYEFSCKTWTNEPERFKLDPCHQMLGLKC